MIPACRAGCSGSNPDRGAFMEGDGRKDSQMSHTDLGRVPLTPAREGGHLTLLSLRDPDGKPERSVCRRVVESETKGTYTVLGLGTPRGDVADLRSRVTPLSCAKEGRLTSTQSPETGGGELT